MVERKRPAYTLIGDALQGAIEAGRLPDGTVLVESALAGLFGSSRSPVKQAFARLEEAGLVRRFDGRGVVVGKAGTPPRRIAVTPALLGLGDAPTEAARDDAWTTLYYAIERDIILRSVFGRFRVNELALARHHGVGRTVARNALVQAQGVGIVSKGDNAQWHTVPLDQERVEQLYELRIVLEPPLLRDAVGRIPAEVLLAIEHRLTAASRTVPDLDVTLLDTLENDLHVRCLGYGRNTEMAEALRRTRRLLVVGKHIQNALPGRPGIDPFMDEHLAIIRAVRAGDPEAAATALVAHLVSSQAKAVLRLKAFHRGCEGEAVPYIAA